MNEFAFGNIEATLQLWLLAMIRPGAAMLAAPFFGAANVPVQLRLVLSLALALPAVSMIEPSMPPDGLVSLAGFAMMAGEVLAGLAMGFTLQIGFAAALLAGEVISNMMGIGFAAMADPATGQPSPAIGQYLSMLALVLFLAADGHLLFFELVFQSYQSLPPGAAWLSATTLKGMIDFGGLMFVAGLAVAMPVLSALLMVQAVFAMVSRSAPTLNLFAVGLPVTLSAGTILLAIATPVMAEALARTMAEALAMSAMLVRG
ncbi:flagellar biosynthetic protein FliR [uncultured Sphingorhabdus sp.]|uniref:flagellar biosynthetic protein FliR n=1 Tax=uncultured Sphingorhabdus sp. TaxID=1686106 RepID=UPI00262B009C|nr:flagellar biosynthetic protein FliR [uncultured Sphingorhabdus sp.]HMS19832.1 flagellar biosynthetic protein FliR [Sphingorhabdus sp.]